MLAFLPEPDVTDGSALEGPHVAEPAIRIRDVSRRYGAFVAVDRMSLDIASGEFCVIVGPSGCGKTTLLRILAGLESPSEGMITVRQTPGSKRPANAMVFQGDSLFPWMTVWNNAAYGLKRRSVPTAQIRDIVGHYLDRTGLTRFADAYPHQLSGGMRQRVSIARAFANDPEILLMDEPFSALDAQNKLLLQDELLRIWDEHKKTVVFITHSVEEAVILGDRIIVMTAQPGRIKTILPVPFGRPREIFLLQALPAFGEFIRDIWSILRDEVEAAKRQNELNVATS
jgi:NitT/TauT family transport system ATP-binding protein